MNDKIFKLKVKNKFISKVRDGYPLINKDFLVDFKKLKEEGSILKLVDDKNKFVAWGYYGKQNKGLGWILSYNEGDEIDKSFFKKKIDKATDKRNTFYNDENNTAFRVFNGEGDGIGGITIDFYDGYYLINWYSQGIYSFKEYVIDILKDIGAKGIYEKKRFNSGGKYVDDDDFVWGDRATFPLMVKENGVNLAVYLNEGAMVGYFMDQRDVRKTIRDKYAKGKTVLNTFSYTGVFSVFAALGGSEKTTSVDLANRSKQKTMEMFSINDLDYCNESIIVEDVFKYFKYAKRKGLSYDVVILDPPSFAKSKKHIFSASKDYVNLLCEAIDITERDGMVVASTNCSSFDMMKFKAFVKESFEEMGRRYKILEEFKLPKDFAFNKKYPQSNYLKVLFIKVD